jgi:protein tyrosine/serine phosphatase
MYNTFLQAYSVCAQLSERSNHPVAFYCTAGKDRTGLVAMLVLSALGVDKESIINDYVLSDSVYADLNDKDAMVGALQQQQVSGCYLSDRNMEHACPGTAVLHFLDRHCT